MEGWPAVRREPVSPDTGKKKTLQTMLQGQERET
jgi:hypothetical protein